VYSGVSQNLNFFDAGRVVKESSFDPNAVGGNPAHRKFLIYTTAFVANNYTLKNLDSLPIAFDDAEMDVDGVPRLEFRSVVSYMFNRLD
jgi:hypothetical protein